MTKDYGRIYKAPYAFAVENISKIISLLNITYPQALTTSLNFRNPF